MAFGDIVQAAESDVGSNNTVAVTLENPVSAGNLLVVAHCTQPGRSFGTQPSGFTFTSRDQTTQTKTTTGYKLAAGGEQSFTFVIDASADQAMAVVEFEGPFDSEDLVEDPFSENGSGAQGTSSVPFATVNVASVPALVVAVAGFNKDANDIGGWANDFVEIIENTGHSTISFNVAIASRVVTQAGQYTTGATLSESGASSTHVGAFNQGVGLPTQVGAVPADILLDTPSGLVVPVMVPPRLSGRRIVMNLDTGVVTVEAGA